MMAEIIRFPTGGRIPTTTIPREEFERLADLALDVVDRIVALLDETEERSVAPEGDGARPCA